LLPESWW